MGASQFIVYEVGDTAKDAFNNAVAEAQYDHGHSGYSGTIAEKDSFTEVPKPTTFSGDWEVHDDPLLEMQFDDKWGPAGCFKVKEGQWCFFGWASS